MHEQSLKFYRMSSEECPIPFTISIQLGKLGDAYRIQTKDAEELKMYEEANEIRRTLDKYVE